MFSLVYAKKKKTLLSSFTQLLFVPNLFAFHYIYSWSQKFAYTLQNLQNVDYFTVNTFWTEWWWVFFLFCLNIILFSFSTALQKLQKTVTSSNSKSFHTLALNAWFLLLEHQWVFESSVIVAYESLSCPRCGNMDLKIIQS